MENMMSLAKFIVVNFAWQLVYISDYTANV